MPKYFVSHATRGSSDVFLHLWRSAVQISIALCTISGAEAALIIVGIDLIPSFSPTSPGTQGTPISITFGYTGLGNALNTSTNF